MIARGINSPPASSLGRLFDAVAALVGLRGEVVYEGQAAIELEVAAGRSARGDDQIYPFAITGERPATLDVAPLIRAVVQDIHAAIGIAPIAERFHRSVAELLATACLRARARRAAWVLWR